MIETIGWFLLLVLFCVVFWGIVSVAGARRRRPSERNLRGLRKHEPKDAALRG